MPILYTLLRARHRPATPPPERPTQRDIPSRPVMAAKKGPQATRSIAIVGGGLAGLSAAYELSNFGYAVIVSEARDRVGGRVHSQDDFAKGKWVERGGELIGSNHTLWCQYAKQLGLLPFADAKDYGNSPIRIGNGTLTFDDSRKVLEAMDDHRQAERARRDHRRSVSAMAEPRREEAGPPLARTVAQDARLSGQVEQTARKMVGHQLAVDNGIDAREQSMLGVLAMIKGYGLDRYWTDTEVYRCKGGNQRLAEEFRRRLPGAVRTGKRVVSVEETTALGPAATAPRTFLVAVDPADREPLEVNEVVLAIPPSLWNSVVFVDKPVLTNKLKHPPRIGRNVKYLMRFNRRFWEDFASSPTLTEDKVVNLTWRHRKTTSLTIQNLRWWRSPAPTMRLPFRT